MTLNIKDWIKKNLDKDQIKEVVEHGCVNGTVSELIYYSDTSAFHDAHEDEIWDMVGESAEEHGQTILEFLATLRGGHVGSMYQLKNLWLGSLLKKHAFTWWKQRARKSPDCLRS